MLILWCLFFIVSLNSMRTYTENKVVQRYFSGYIYCTTFNNCTTLVWGLEATWGFLLVLVLVF